MEGKGWWWKEVKVSDKIGRYPQTPFIFFCGTSPLFLFFDIPSIR